MTESKVKSIVRIALSSIVYLVGLGAQIITLFFYTNLDTFIKNQNYFTALYIFFIIYILFGVYLVFGIFLSKKASKGILGLIILFAVIVVSFPFVNMHNPNQNIKLYQYNHYNYLLRDINNYKRNQRDAEVFLNNYLEDKKVYVNETDSYVFSDDNKFIQYGAYDFEIITDSDNQLIITDEQAEIILRDSNYTRFIYGKVNIGVGSIYVFVYIGEDLEDINEFAACFDSKGQLYFIPMDKWEEMK